MASIELLEGVVTRVRGPEIGQVTQKILIDALVADQGYEVRGIQVHLKKNFQERMIPGSRILFYRDTSANFKFAMLLTDPPTDLISPPIWVDSIEDESDSGRPTFEDGDVAFSARGRLDAFIPTLGSTLWLKNNGDAFLSSGSQSQKISVNDSTDSVDIQGSDIDISTIGNTVTTHSLTFSTSLAGLTSSTWGLKNPVTGIFTSGINISNVGSINIGVFDPVLGTSISGLGYSFLTQSLTLTSVTTTITSANINLTGLLSALGNTSITGSFGVTGNSSLTGNLSVSGIVTLPAIPSTLFVGVTPGFTGTVTTPTSITVINGIVTAVT